MVSVKYVFIVLNADDEGEGGTFALYSLLSRYVCFPLTWIERREPLTRKVNRPISSSVTQRKNL